MLEVRFTRLYSRIKSKDANEIFGELVPQGERLPDGTRLNLDIGYKGSLMHIAEFCSRRWQDDITDLPILFNVVGETQSGTVVDMIKRLQELVGN